MTATMGSETPDAPPTLRRNAYSFDRLTSIIGLGHNQQTAAFSDFAGSTDDLERSDWSDNTAFSLKPPGLGRMNAPSTDSISSVGTADGEAAPTKPERMRRISAPAMKYGQGAPDPSKLEVPEKHLPKDRRVSHGDRGGGSSYGMIMNWLAYTPTQPCNRISESEETDGPTAPTLTGNHSNALQPPLHRPISDAVKAMDGMADGKRLRNKPVGRSEWNALAPSNW